MVSIPPSSPSDNESYAGGRFLDVPAPDEADWIVVDFNRAYNPPCVFTLYATCPIPPDQNILPIPVMAGERMYFGIGHEPQAPGEIPGK